MAGRLCMHQFGGFLLHTVPDDVWALGSGQASIMHHNGEHSTFQRAHDLLH